MDQKLYPMLKDTVRIKKMKSFCWVAELLSDSGTTASPYECFVLSLCTGEYALSVIEYMVSEIFHFSREEAGQTVGAILDRMKTCIAWKASPVKKNSRYQPESFLYRPEEWEANPRGRFESPVDAVFALTKSCNFRCIYCYNSSGIKKQEELCTGQWLDAVRQMKELDVVKCTLTGGEPLMHPGFFEILEAVMENGILPYVCTNGSLLDEEAVRRMKGLSLPMVQISLDSASPEEHDALTCSSNTFGTITRAMEKLVGAGIKVYVKAVVLPRNLERVPALIDLCCQLGVSNLVLDRYDLSYQGRGNQSFFLNSSQEERLKDLVNAEREKDKNKDMNINLISGPRNWKCSSDTVMCGAFIQSFVIMPDGEYALCEKLEHIPGMSVGNFKELSIRQMWHSPKIDEITLPPKERYAEPCRSCEDLPICGSGCYAAKLFVSDDLYGPDPKCWRAHYKNNQFITEE